MKKRIVAVALLLILGTLGLAYWCAGSGRHATQAAADQLEELHTKDLPAFIQEAALEPEEVEVFEHVLEQFYRTQDARYVEPQTGLSMLHMACMFKKTELARCLLLDGADPNAHRAGDDSPLLLALGTWLAPKVTTQQIVQLVDTLLAGGAVFEKSGHNATDFLTQAALVCEDEEALLHLMQKGAKADADTGVPLALHGYARALAQALKMQGDTGGMLEAAARGVCCYDGQYVACVEELLRHGADVQGSAALHVLAEGLSSMDEGSPRREAALELFARLVQHGADPYRRDEEDEEYPGFCAYDFLAMRPGLLERLSEMGLALRAPELRFSSGTALLSEVCRAAMSPLPTSSLAPHFDAIAAMLTPSADMLRHEIFPEALSAAVGMLAQVDPARAAQRIQASSLWEGYAAGGTDDALAALVRVLQDDTRLALPQEFICTQAEALMQGGREEEAAGLVELLARCPEAQTSILRYCADARPPMQAGGYAALLCAEGLPDARNNGVADWLAERRRAADTPFLRSALLLTSLEKLWLGQMPADEQQRMLVLMREIGAPRAAAMYEKISRHLNNPDELDNLFSRGDDWKYELEAATARFFLEHKNEFTPLSAP